MKINAKMKLLSLAILGLGGMAMAGSAAAACPTSPTPPWTDLSTFQGSVAIASPGMGGTDCLLTSKINAGATSFASAAVHDNSPSAESRYRASFIVNIDALAAPTLSTGAQIFSATSSSEPVRLGVFGSGGVWYLSYFVGTSTSGSVPLATGDNHIEFDLKVGSAGSLTVWINSNSESSPTVPAISLDNSAMVGIDDAYLGLAAPTAAFVSKYAGVAAKFDQFDSRRSQFIGY